MSTNAPPWRDAAVSDGLENCAAWLQHHVSETSLAVVSVNAFLRQVRDAAAGKSTPGEVGDAASQLRAKLETALKGAAISLTPAPAADAPVRSAPAADIGVGPSEATPMTPTVGTCAGASSAVTPMAGSSRAKIVQRTGMQKIADLEATVKLREEQLRQLASVRRQEIADAVNE
jgi:hypothetical protein